MSAQTESDTIVAGLGTQQLLVVGGGLLALVAVALPWVTASFMGQSVSVSGYKLLTEGMGQQGGSPIFNGGVTGALSVIAIGLTVARDWDQTTGNASIVLGLLIAVVGAMFVVAPATALGVSGQAAAMVSSIVNPGVGIYLTIVGGVAVLAGGAMDYTN